MISSSQFFAYSGAHYTTCPVEFREILAKVATAQKINEVLTQIIPHQKIEFVPISTCNRFDICFFGQVSKKEIIQIYTELFKGIQQNASHSSYVDPEKIEHLLRIEFDENALRTLFKISASLDSLVLGESQIFGQMKEAFLQATELNYAQNSALQIFNKCFYVAKKVRYETDIGKNSTSISSAAIDIISRIFEKFTHKKILIIGAGEMARITAENILQKKAQEIFIANRTYSKAEKLAYELGQAWPFELKDALCHIHEFDICIVAAAGNEYLIHEEHLQNYAKKRQGNLSVFIDLSVPRKIDPALSEIDNLFLFNIDDLEIFIEQNKKNRENAALLCEKIIEEQVHEFMVLYKQKENLVNVGKFHHWVKNIINDEITRYMIHLNNGKKIDQTIIADAAAKKIISHTAILARNHIKPENKQDSVGDLLEFLFNLSQQSAESKTSPEKNNVITFPTNTHKKKTR